MIKFKDILEATIKKPSKAAVNPKAESDYNKAKTALAGGAKLVTTDLYNRTDYGIEYPTGGYFKITKSLYDKLKND